MGKYEKENTYDKNSELQKKDIVISRTLRTLEQYEYAKEKERKRKRYQIKIQKKIMRNDF